MNDLQSEARQGEHGHQDHGHDHGGHCHANHAFYFGTHKLEAPAERVKVRALKELIRKHVEGFNVEHTLVQEACGDHPDKPLHDDDEVHICDFPHFYDQPPANFG
jgi:hypothetical protein